MVTCAPAVDGEAGGAGAADPGASPAPGHAGDVPATATSTADRIAGTELLIVRLEADLAEARAAGEAAGETRARVALAAAEGAPAARAELEAATVAATRAVLGGQNVELALAGARARLAELRDLAEAERLASERLEALALCDRRAEAARAVDDALRALAAAMKDWSGTRTELAGYARRGQGWLDIRLDASPVVPSAMVAAGGREFPTMMGLGSVNPSPEEVLPLAEADWVLLHARRERGEEVDLTNPRLRRHYPPAVASPAPAAAGPVVETDDGPMRRLASGQWVPVGDDGLDEAELAEPAARRAA